MTAHDHTEYVEGCFRCDLSRDEPLTAEDNAPRRRTEPEARRCSQIECPGDGRYQPPGKGHLPDCQHNAVAWVWETVTSPAETREAPPVTDWPGDVTPLPHARPEDRLRARLAAMVAAHCSTPDCPGDYRYPPPGRGHVPGCTCPFAPDEETDR